MMTHTVNDNLHVLSAERARTELHWAIVSTLCRILHDTPLPAVEVLVFAAASIGAIYREIVEAHRGMDGCPCGWKPDEPRDVEALLTALETAIRSASDIDLRTVPVAGRA